jgi:predicted aspartyl protease
MQPPFTTGHFDERGNPCLKFRIRGVAPEGLELSGTIDTGFTGFIQVPIEHAFRLRLPLEGSASYTLADGSTGSNYTAIGHVTFGGVELEGVITLEPYDADILIGLAFLRQFKLALTISSKIVSLMSEDWLNEFSAKVTATLPKPKTGDNAPPPNLTDAPAPKK